MAKNLNFLQKSFLNKRYTISKKALIKNKFFYGKKLSKFFQDS